MLRFSKYLEEGVNDPAIFKAIFLAGGPGSGKSFIVGKTGLTSLGYKVVNSDDAFENAPGISEVTDLGVMSPFEIEWKARVR